MISFHLFVPLLWKLMPLSWRCCHHLIGLKKAGKPF